MKHNLETVVENWFVKYWQSSSVPSDHRESMLLLGRNCAWGSLNSLNYEGCAVILVCRSEVRYTAKGCDILVIFAIKVRARG